MSTAPLLCSWANLRLFFLFSADSEVVTGFHVIYEALYCNCAFRNILKQSLIKIYKPSYRYAMFEKFVNSPQRPRIHQTVASTIFTLTHVHLVTKFVYILDSPNYKQFYFICSRTFYKFLPFYRAFAAEVLKTHC